MLNVIVLRLGKLGGAERGTVLVLNSTVTYAAALAGPLVLGLLYAGSGFSALVLGAAVSVVLATIATVLGAWRRRDPLTVQERSADALHRVSS